MKKSFDVKDPSDSAGLVRDWNAHSNLGQAEEKAPTLVGIAQILIWILRRKNSKILVA